MPTTTLKCGITLKNRGFSLCEFWWKRLQTQTPVRVGYGSTLFCFFLNQRNVYLCVYHVQPAERDSKRSVNLVLQCSDCSALTMESCVWEVFIEQGSPHEWVCTIIPSVCLLPCASFFALPGFCLQLPHISGRTVFLCLLFIALEQEVFPWVETNLSGYYFSIIKATSMEHIVHT